MNVEGHCFDLTVREDTAIRRVLMELREVSGDCEFIVNVEFLQRGCVCVCACARARSRKPLACGCARADAGGSWLGPSATGVPQSAGARRPILGELVWQLHGDLTTRCRPFPPCVRA